MIGGKCPPASKIRFKILNKGAKGEREEAGVIGGSVHVYHRFVLKF